MHQRKCLNQCYSFFKVDYDLLIASLAQMHFPYHAVLVRRREQNAAEFGQSLLALVADGLDCHAYKV